MTEPASSPCRMGQDGGARPFLGDGTDFAQVRLWRQAERERLRAERSAMPEEARTRATAAIQAHLSALITEEPVSGRVIAVYWPIQNEPDLGPWFDTLRGQGAVLALPVPVSPPQPMTFRRWDAGARLVRGFGKIPVPPEDAPEVTPGVVLAPVIGWDDAGFRLGYGAGYFDRTLASLTDPPLAIGLGYQSARLPTIVPQRHDVPMHVVVTECGIQTRRPPLPKARGWA